MADTDTETLQNGTATLTEEEEERLKQRPADIDADVREMERRKRVEALMSSKLFREELERVLDQQITEGGDAPLLQRIREMVGGRLHSGSLRGPSCVLPINDIRGIEGVGYEKGEKILRCKLAAVYRLVDLFGWTQTGLNGQITARLNTAVEQVLTTPRGLLPHEVTASSLVKVDMQGVIQDQGTTNFPINVEGFSLHAAVHAARPDIRCVLHVRSHAALCVSCVSRGLLPLCHEAAKLGEFTLHRAPLGILDNEEKDKLVRALGPHSKVLILANDGVLCCGATLEEAFYHARLFTAAAEVQLRLAAIPMDQLSLIDDVTRRQIYEASLQAPADATKWRMGGEEFEGLMRMLDNAGFRTGYIYRHPRIKNDVPKPKNDVEVPPAVSSLGYLLEEEELYRQGLWKKGTGKCGERTRWLNSPNVYQRVEVLETGTNDPKKITKWVDANTEEWVQDGSPAHSSTPVKIDTLQFVPKNTNPKEFKKLQQQIKENRRADKISAGPQSHILEGVTWDEANQLAEDAANTHTGDHVVLMGAASKGIIQRGYQHNATVYSAPYARNPFDRVTDTEIEAYHRAVTKGKDYDTDLSESEAISGAQITSPASAPSETEEESRDEHRVLRIETMQAPVPSQPEVVLSDVDTTDFLNAERSHADRTKVPRDPVVSDDDVFYPPSVTRGVQSVITASVQQRALGRDPNLLSDDEVFLDSSVSTMTSGVISPMTSPQPAPAHVIVRSNTVAITRNVRGTNEANPLTEALSANKRSAHEYTRSASFENIVKFYESPIKTDENKIHPKCKTSLHSRLNEKAEPLASSRSSLVSIPSIEWDGKAKSDYALRTRSLPRSRVTEPLRLYRTRSHCGFINAYIKDPNPKHYHLPRCRSCGATSNSFSWELTKEELLKKVQTQSVYRSLDNIPQKCSEETERPIKVKQTVVPVFKVEKVPEFVDSQEFTEDNYLCDIGTSFSSENQTVIEKKDLEVDSLDVTVTKDNNKGHGNDNDVYRAECIQINPVDDMNTSLDTTEGEYHSFTDDFEEAYESPVKDLVDKDIRDYSVPINLYCDDYLRKNEISPKKSPYKGIDVAKTVLEPILEESKSSYGDDSLSKLDSDIKSLVESAIADVLDAAVITVAQNSDRCDEMSMLMLDKITKVTSELEIGTQQETMLNTEKEKDFTPLETETHICRIDNSISLNTDHRKSSVEHSVASSTAELVTMDSTAEFEKIEFISELLSSILNRIEFAENGMLYVIGQRNINEPSKKRKIDHIINGDDLVAADTEIALEEIYESPKPQQTCKIEKVTDEPRLTESIKIPQTHDEDNEETFSIMSLIDDMESKLNLNETVLTENSDSGITEAFKISESFLYYIFNRAVFISNNKNKKITIKTVVTVVDPEDIMYTADTLWPIDANDIDPADSHDKSYIVYSDSMYRSIEFDRCSNYNRVNRNTSEDFYEEIDDLNVSTLSDTEEIENELDVNDEYFAENNVHEDNLNIENVNEHIAINVNLEAEYLNNNIVELFRENSPVDQIENAFDIDTEYFAENNVANDILNVENIDEYNAINFVALELADLNNNVEAQFRANNVVDQIDNAIHIDDEYFAGNNAIDAIINVDYVDNPNARNVIPLESEDGMEEHFMENIPVGQIENEDSDSYSTNDVESKELSDNGIEVADEIVYKNYASYESNDKSYEDNLGNGIRLDNDLNDTFIEHDIDEINNNNDLNLNETAFDTFSDLNQIISSGIDLNDTIKLDHTNKVMENNSGVTFIETLDEMNIAFVHTSSSPEKASTVFESCTESPIKNSNVSFLSQEIGGDTISSSPFINRPTIISMSLTENTGGIKYWVSFDDSVSDKYEFTDRVWRKIKQVDDTVPSFYGVKFEEKDNETYPKYRKMSVLVEDSPKTESGFENDEISNNCGVHKIETDAENVDKELLELSLPSSSSFYKTCDLLEDESPQKKLLLYEVHKRRLHSTWPPYEDTLFYRIISKFRMSESFDPSELDNARINSL